MSDKIIPDRKEYYKNYYKTNKSYWKDEITCKLCNKIISRQSYSKHLKSKVHKVNFLIRKSTIWKIYQMIPIINIIVL